MFHVNDCELGITSSRLPLSRSDKFIRKIDSVAPSSLEVGRRLSNAFHRRGSSQVAEAVRNNKIEFLIFEFGREFYHHYYKFSGANIPFCVFFRGFDASQMLYNKAYVKFLKEHIPNARFICATSKSLKRNLENVGIEHPDFEVLPSGVDFGGCSNRRDIISGVILNIGRFVEKKGQASVIRAFSKVASSFDGLELHFVGDGPMLSECRSLARELGVESRTVFHGAKSRERVQDLLINADVYVQNSVQSQDGDEEGVPNVIMEAMAAGLPIVASRHGGIPEVIEDGYSGIIFDEDDADALALGVSELLRNRELADRFARNARRFAKDNLRSEDIHGRLENLILKHIGYKF